MNLTVRDVLSLQESRCYFKWLGGPTNLNVIFKVYIYKIAQGKPHSSQETVFVHKCSLLRVFVCLARLTQTSHWLVLGKWMTLEALNISRRIKETKGGTQSLESQESFVCQKA